MANNNKKQKSSFQTVKDVIWLFIFAGGLLAFWNVSGGVDGIIDKVDYHTKAVDSSYKKCSKTSNWIECFTNSKPNTSNNNTSTTISSSTDSSLNNESSEPSSEELSSEEPSSKPKEENGNNTISTTTNYIKDTIKNGKNKKDSSEKEELINKLNNLNVVSSYNKVPYIRTEWKHWDMVEGSNCWSIREEALYQQAEPKSIVLLDKNHKETKNKAKACSIKSGVWKDPYTNQVIKDPTKTDLDHTSPLAATARAGGQDWSKEQKERFANDLDHLVVTSPRANRQKGDKTPSEWLPEKKSSWCNYSKIYINILSKYNLNITQKDKDVLNKNISSCRF